MSSFENLMELAQSLEPPRTWDQRSLEWCDKGHVLGLARQPGGAFEVFISGPALVAQRSGVRRHLRFDSWETASHGRFSANRIVLPNEDHYAAVAAFLAEEMLRLGVLESPQDAFTRAEPVIEMALRRAAAEEEVLLGLLGELRFLTALLHAASTPSERARVLGSWRGYERSARDFQIDSGTAVEVKVTRGPTSTHHISNVSQVDPRRTSDGAPTERLFLLSIGVTALEEASSPAATRLSVASLTESVLTMLAAGEDSGPTEIQELFLSRLKTYGPKQAEHYDHATMRDWAVYSEPWAITFERAYDMASPNMDVLRRADLDAHSFVSADSVNFVATFPPTTGEDGNPETDLLQFARRILG